MTDFLKCFFRLIKCSLVGHEVSEKTEDYFYESGRTEILGECSFCNHPVSITKKDEYYYEVSEIDHSIKCNKCGATLKQLEYGMLTVKAACTCGGVYE